MQSENAVAQPANDEHALLAPSSAGRWLVCPGSIRLGYDIPSESSVWAQEGTEAHILAENMLMTGVIPESGDSDMLGHVQGYVDFVRANLDWDSELYVEVKGPCTKEPRLAEYLYGTADALIINADTLHVIDFKYGAGVRIFAENNPQLMCYALAAYYSEHCGPRRKDIKNVKLSVFQPRVSDGGEDSWELSLEELLYWEDVTLIPGAAEALFVTGEVKSGGHCRFCPAAGVVCFTGAQDVAPIIEARLDLDKAVKVLSLEQPYKTVLEAARAMLFQQLSAGVKVPGAKLVQGRMGNRAWVDEAQAGKALAKYIDEQKLFERKILSPAQAQKLLPKEHQDLIDPLVTRKPGATVVALDVDYRKAVEGGMGSLD